MVEVMSFVICFGVNRGVQMVFRYPPKGVGVDLYSRSVPYSDDLKTTLGVRTDHLSFLLCPQQIGTTPESDEITVETFSFHVRYFHVQSGPIRHLAVVVAMQTIAAADQAREASAFLDAYSQAVAREQNRCNYLQQAVEHLSKTRDRAEDTGTWSTILAGNLESASSLVRELITITDVLQEGGRIQIHVNGWLYLVSKADINLSRNSKAVFCAEQLLGTTQNADSGYRSRQTVDSYTYLMVHPELPQPLGARIQEAADILREVSLPQILSFLAAPCSILDFREQVRRRMVRVATATSPGSASQSHHPHVWAGTGALPSHYTTLKQAGGAGSTGSGGGGGVPVSSPTPQATLKHSTFNRLLDWLVNKNIARVLKTHYVFQPHLFDSFAQSFADKQSRKTRDRAHRIREHNDGSRTARDASTAGSEPGASSWGVQSHPSALMETSGVGQGEKVTGIGGTFLVGGDTVPDSRASPSSGGVCLRRYIERHITFLEMLARMNNSRSRVGVKAVDIIENLRQLIDFFDGKTPKEEILCRVPSVTPESLDEVVFVFQEFITTIIA